MGGPRGVARRVERISAAYRQGEDGGTALPYGLGECDETSSRVSATAIERLAGLVEAQRHVSDNVAHEIRTPLLHLDGRLWELLKKMQDDETATTLGRAWGDIRAIVALLDIASNEAQRGDPDGLLPFDLSALAEDVADTYRSSLEEAGLRCEMSIAGHHNHGGCDAADAAAVQPARQRDPLRAVGRHGAA